MKKKARNLLLELLLVFFFIANVGVWSTAQGYYGSNTLFVIRGIQGLRNAGTARIRSMGGEWVREEFNWQTLNPRRGRWDLANADHAVNIYRRNGAKVLGMLCYSSLWGSSNPKAGLDAQFYKPNINDWKNFVGTMVRRYGGTVKDWEIWNEPNAMWKPSPNIDEYREVLIAAYDTIKSIDPGAKVGSGGTTYIDDDFINAFLDNGGWEHLDAISVHIYPWGGAGPESDPNQRLRDHLQDLVYNTILPRGGGKEIWITEMGWQSGQIGEENQASNIARGVILARATNEVTKILIFNMRDEPGNTFGLMRSNLRPKPAYNYYKKTIEMLGAKRISQWFDLDNDSKFYIFGDGGGAVAAAWNPEHDGQITGFHVNASGMHCFDMAGHDISGSVILAWNGGDTTFVFGKRPVFCQLDNYYVAESDQVQGEPKVADIAQVAGVALSAVSGDEVAEPGVLGTIEGFLGSSIQKGRVTAYQKTDSGWQEFSQQKVADSSFNLDLPEGQYYLAYEAPGYISSSSQPFGVAGDEDITLETRLLNTWLPMLLLAGGFLVLVLLVLKYSRKKKPKGSHG